MSSLTTSRPRLSRHARDRMRRRGVAPAAIRAALDYGLHRDGSGAESYFLGRQEIREAAGDGVDLSRFAGINVVCDRDGQVVTVYRRRKSSHHRLTHSLPSSESCS